MSRSRKILIVADRFYPDAVGGSERVAYETALRLARRGHRITVIAGGAGSGRIEPTETFGLRRIRYSCARRGRTAFYLTCVANCRRTVAALLRRSRFDAVVLHHPLSSLAAALAGAHHKAPVIRFYYGPAGDEYHQRTVGRLSEDAGVFRALRQCETGFAAAVLHRLEDFTIRRCRRVIVLSRYSADQLRETHGFPVDRTIQCPAGVDSDRFHPTADRDSVRRRLGLPTDRFLILTVRRLDYRTGVDSLVKALPLLDDSLNSLLVVAGKGPRSTEVSQMARAPRIRDRVCLAGFVPEDDLPLYYQAADLFVLPSRSLEGFGLATLEALASGLPVLGTPVGATPEILGPLDARLILGASDPRSIAEGISRLARDKQTLRTLSLACREYAAQHYRWDALADVLEKAASAESD